MIEQKISSQVIGGACWFLQPEKELVRIVPDINLRTLDNQREVTITWEEMTDYPVLAEKLGLLRLKDFKPVAEALGVMYSNRELYEALIE